VQETAYDQHRRFDLSPQRRQLLERLLRAEASSARRRRWCTGAPIRARRALTFSQSRVWFLDQFTGNGAAYSSPQPSESAAFGRSVRARL